jgi:hypothetical protein
MVFGRRFIIPGLDWVVSATEVEMLDFLGPEVACPRCGGRLRQDLCEGALALADDGGHSFSNVRALVVELYQRGMLRPKVTTLASSAVSTTAA